MIAWFWLVPLDLVVAFAVVGGMDSTHVLKVTKDVGRLLKHASSLSKNFSPVLGRCDCA